ncbi:MAG: DsbA family protein [Rubrivivax sp.]|nr:DsbA family protein [Rubrivivax sp.]
MSGPVEFWFDFGSPYAYLAAEKLPAIVAAQGRTLRWRPVLLFAVLRKLDLPPPMGHPAKRDYLLMDFDRSARHLGVPYRHPTRFPVVSPWPARLFHALAARDEAAAAAFARDALRAAFRDDQPLDEWPALLALAARHDDRGADALLAAADGAAARAALAAAIDEAAARGLFGSPFVVIDGEGFFGADRLPQVEARLAGTLAPHTPLPLP